MVTGEPERKSRSNFNTKKHCSKGKIAIVVSNEEGLINESLNFCHVATSINLFISLKTTRLAQASVHA
jgi:tRNA C32,U32 (ribose-2'-O)-methylase TrmJ